MKQRTEGFASILLILGAVALLGLGYVAYKKYDPQLGGATVYTTQLSDTFNTFRQQVNSSTANLNTEVEVVSGTVNAYGTIVSQNTPLAAAAGGTGTTTLPSNAQFLSASGVVPTWKTFLFGAGLNTTTTATSVQINTTGFDPTASYGFTGNNTHTGTEAFSSSTSFSATSTFTGTVSLPVPNMVPMQIATSTLGTTVSIGAFPATSTVATLSFGAVGPYDQLFFQTAISSTDAVNGGNLYFSLDGVSLCNNISSPTDFKPFGYATMQVNMLGSTSLESFNCIFYASNTTPWAWSGMASINMSGANTASTTIRNGNGGTITYTSEFFNATKQTFR